MSTAVFCATVLHDFKKAERYFERALKGREDQLDKDHEDTNNCVKGLAMWLKFAGNTERLERLKRTHQW